MAMHAQTPVQIASTTRDIDRTEQALTSMPGPGSVDKGRAS
jgi:hypothetical protein